MGPSSSWNHLVRHLFPFKPPPSHLHTCFVLPPQFSLLTFCHQHKLTCPSTKSLPYKTASSPHTWCPYWDFNFRRANSKSLVTGPSLLIIRSSWSLSAPFFWSQQLRSLALYFILTSLTTFSPWVSQSCHYPSLTVDPFMPWQNSSFLLSPKKTLQIVS